MSIIYKNNLKKCVRALKDGNVIAYPTESVFGLGCDPDNKDAVMKLLKIKKRSIDKGLIIISSNYAYLKKYVYTKEVSEKNIKKFYKFWPGNFTLLHPAKNTVPIWITGFSKLVAVRITNNVYVKSLCKNFGKAIISTSANLHGLKPCINVKEIFRQFGNRVHILHGCVGLSKNTSTIINIVNGEYIRHE
ncbi:L-threonylcarbamoyladenylate synthase [Buchnera aphidicola (Chaitoregma tattakana)]|uniref:L-threonylcarbamoyladenylate synthase n=1 Tax=Buchnera aphidicola TaxID=9 RepID=UPI0031B88270